MGLPVPARLEQLILAGRLFVVATPLGNLQDLSPRAIETLRTVDRIACEDTRRTSKLLTRHAISTPTFSCHKFNEKSRLQPVIEALREGTSVALVADGGTPGISDPGSLLVRAALEAGIEVSPVAGPSAVTALLSACGFPADRYVFDGFLPHRAGERRRRLRDLREERRTIVVFETPHRLRAALEDISEVVGPRPMVLGRELTKIHETILRGSADELLRILPQEIRGEITLVLSGAEDEARPALREPRAERILAAWREALAENPGDRRAALKHAARQTGMKRAELYRMLAELGEDSSNSSSAE